jgi:hypothetical protein
MKNFKEEIEAMKAQIAALENNLVCGDGQCGCGCDESPVEVTPQQANAIVFTKEELIDFATRLMTRTATACKEAVNNIDLDPEYICDLSLNSHNQIEIEVDNSAIVGAVESEIDDVVELDNDSVEAEVNSIIDDMLLESEVKDKLFP